MKDVPDCLKCQVCGFDVCTSGFEACTSGFDACTSATRHPAGLIWIQFFLIFCKVFWPSTIKNHIKNNDFESKLPNWIDFQTLPKFSKRWFWQFSAVFSLTFHVFDLSISKFVFKRFIFIQQQILEARFSPSNSTFYFPFSSYIFSILWFPELRN